ncbi:hypothetical protein [Exiguobacterium qingdaonense]|uniref:hypothetical protein n=1 Tax=Exiguobacterium qingdaonense TaxID=2751251 RepID=UPI001BEA7007|nr:hypothetical protein [Exiguobacterium qingdaonense]
MKSTKLAIALAGLLAVSGTGVYASTNDTTTDESTMTESTQCEHGEKGSRTFGDRKAGHVALIEALGLTEEEVNAARENRQALPELAEEKGISIEAFIDAIMTSHEEKLATAVEEGKLTREEADQILADHEERFADVSSYDDLEDARGMRGGREGGRHGHGHGPHHDDASESDSNVENQSNSL